MGPNGALRRAGRTDRRAKQLTLFRLVGSSLMKGHEDGGLECLWNGRKLFHAEA